MSQRYECIETQKAQDGKGLEGALIEHEHSPRAMQLRVCTRQVNVRSKAVFSNAMALMDKIRGWEDEESWVGSKFAACMWIYTKEALTGGQILDLEQEEYLKKRMMSIMLCTNWVCAGTHEWVSSRTIIQQEKEILSMALRSKIEVPCVVQWGLLWFSAPTDLNRILGSNLKSKSITIVRPFSGERTPKSCMLTSVVRVLQRTHKKEGVN